MSTGSNLSETFSIHPHQHGVISYVSLCLWVCEHVQSRAVFSVCFCSAHVLHGRYVLFMSLLVCVCTVSGVFECLCAVHERCQDSGISVREKTWKKAAWIIQLHTDWNWLYASHVSFALKSFWRQNGVMYRGYVMFCC